MVKTKFSQVKPNKKIHYLNWKTLHNHFFFYRFGWFNRQNGVIIDKLSLRK